MAQIDMRTIGLDRRLAAELPLSRRWAMKNSKRKGYDQALEDCQI